MSSPAASVKKIIKLIRNDLAKNHSNYIFFITSKCNQACEFCFYRDNINKSDDLSLEQIKSLSSKLGNISNLLLSGGEPVLRKDFLEIIDIFIKNNRMKSFTIPSNGMAKNLICNTVNQILNKYPEIYLQVCVSLDGPQKLHDKLRGVDGAYEKAIETIKVLEKLAKQYEKLSFNINTVINPANVSLIGEIIRRVKSLDMQCYTHSFEIVRPKNIKAQKAAFDDSSVLKKAYNVILKYKDENYLRRLNCSVFKKTILGACQYANIYSLYKTQFDYLIKGKNWPMECCAGLDNNVIYNNGDLAICELQEPIANIRDISGKDSLNKIFEGKRNQIKKCSCTHLCYILLSMYKSKKMLFVLMPLRAIKYFFVRLKLSNYF